MGVKVDGNTEEEKMPMTIKDIECNTIITTSQSISNDRNSVIIANKI